jgi:hemoglobin-like flavoprotein
MPIHAYGHPAPGSSQFAGLAHNTTATVGAATPHPSLDVIRLVQFNCQRLFPQQALMVDHFHSMLRDLVPEIQRLTAVEDRQVSEQIVATVLWSALTQEPTAVIEHALNRLGQDNHSRGFPREGYLGVGHALLRSARTITDSGWSSELSSAWVAYYSWLADQLKTGADTAQEQACPNEDPHRGGGEASLLSLDDVLTQLRNRYFADDDRGLESICTRVMLRTGADLYAPRPDQRQDAAVITDVLTALTIMGYVLSDLGGIPHRPPGPVMAPTTDPAPAVRGTAHGTAGSSMDSVRHRRRPWFRLLSRREFR